MRWPILLAAALIAGYGDLRADNAGAIGAYVAAGELDCKTMIRIPIQKRVFVWRCGDVELRQASSVEGFGPPVNPPPAPPPPEFPGGPPGGSPPGGGPPGGGPGGGPPGGGGPGGGGPGGGGPGGGGGVTGPGGGGPGGEGPGGGPGGGTGGGGEAGGPALIGGYPGRPDSPGRGSSGSDVVGAIYPTGGKPGRELVTTGVPEAALGGFVMPGTGSALPFLGMLGLLCLAFGLGLRYGALRGRRAEGSRG